MLSVKVVCSNSKSVHILRVVFLQIKINEATEYFPDDMLEALFGFVDEDGCVDISDIQYISVKLIFILNRG
jgi:hypothetical protein